MTRTTISPRRSLAWGAAANWAAFAAALAVSFFLAPYLIRALGDARYGVWCVVEAILAYFTLFDLGVAATLLRATARRHAADSRAELNKVVSASLAVFLLAGGCVLLVALVLVPLVAPGLARAAPGVGDVGPFMLLMAVNCAVTLPLNVFPTVLYGLQRFAVPGAVRTGFLLLRVGSIVVVTEHTPGLFGLAVVYTAVNLLEHAVMIALVFRHLPGLRIGRRHVDRATIRDVLRGSVDAFLAMLAGRVTGQTGAIVAGGFLGAAAAAHFAVAARLTELAKNLLKSATTTLTPAVSARDATGDHDGVRRVLLDGTRWVLYVVVPVHLGLLFFGRPFLHRWLGGPQYAESCYPPLVILSATLTIGVAQSVAARVLYGLGRLKLFARLALGEAALNLTLSLALVGPWGLTGVATAVAGPNVLFCLFAIAYTCRVVGSGVGRYVVGAWLKPLAAATVPAAVWASLGGVEPTWIGIATGIAAGLLPYAAVVGLVESRPLRSRDADASPQLRDEPTPAFATR